MILYDTLVCFPSRSGTGSSCTPSILACSGVWYLLFLFPDRFFCLTCIYLAENPTSPIILIAAVSTIFRSIGEGGLHLCLICTGTWKYMFCPYAASVRFRSKTLMRKYPFSPTWFGFALHSECLLCSLASISWVLVEVSHVVHPCFSYVTLPVYIFVFRTTSLPFCMVTNPCNTGAEWSNLPISIYDGFGFHAKMSCCYIRLALAASDWNCDYWFE